MCSRPPSLSLAGSKKGEGNFRLTMEFAPKAKVPTRIDALIRDEGGRHFDTWRAEYPEVIPWLDKQLAVNARQVSAPRSPQAWIRVRGGCG
ncbi:hypothetical protein [Streptantibioticus ferralitis]|uniref:Uncharacterized protein n=1 Tax=Streptantibioticus ferralitis TaxID=236510 RepID=A0ABT5Z2N1_9ACTN|nr:hypothetical protein [Streptantibioticus ferralitis]MDF2258033.1 hypothetical protein [Streptantibioticus ferralitis]